MTEIDVVEIEMLRLPCGHLTPRPTTLAVTIACPCGQTWRLEHGRGEWSAREVTTG